MKHSKMFRIVHFLKRRNILISLIIILGIFCNLQAQQIFINEFLASNITINPDNADFDDYSDWVEIYNAEDFSVDLGGYYLTDNLNNKTKWRIPEGTSIEAKSFIRFWADGYDDVPGNTYARPVEPHNNFTTKWFHLNFKLSRAGEEIGIFSLDETQIDAIVFGLQLQDVSYGRKPDGGSSWFYFGEPTPGSSNTTMGTLNTETASVPIYSQDGGFYNGSQVISLSTNSSSAVIKYTTDGSRPSSSSPEFNTGITINRTTVLRTRVFDGDKLPGQIVTHTYIIDENPTLPVISISAFPETLWDEEIGIYQNLLKDREIPISFEFSEPDGSPGFSLNAGLRLTGQASFMYPQKPFTIYTRDRFGVEEVNYQIFPNRDVHKFKNIYLRNSGCQDNRHTLFRDALQHCIVINQMDIDCQAYRPAMTFINGDYWGIYNVREKLNSKYIASHHNVDPNNLDYLEFDFNEIPVVIEGDLDNYNELMDFLENNDLSIRENYGYVEIQIDINEFTNYLITEIYCDNINWPYTNMRWWREKTDNSKWRWVLLDMDYGFAMEGSSFYTNNSFYLATSISNPYTENFPWSTYLIRKLLENSDFTNELIQRFAIYLNTTFHEDRVLNIVDSLKTLIGTEMERHIDRWNDDPADILGDPPIPDMSTWLQKVELMREFAVQRPIHQRQHIIDFFGLSGTAELTLNIPESDKGRVFISNIEMADGYSGTHFKDIPIQLKAVPNAGYKFVRWQGLSGSDSDSISAVLTGDASITAVFENSDENTLPSSISEDMVLTYGNSPYLALGDITVDAGATLQIQAGVEIRMPESASIYVYGSINVNGSEAQPVLIIPNTNSGAVQWGALCLVNSADSSSISYLQIKGASNGSDTENQIGAISAYNSNMTLNHVQIEDSPFPVFVQYGKVKISNCVLHSDKICDLINVKYASSALVENCDLRGNNSYDTDAVDYDQISNGIIRGNRIYNFYGVNSDGIDLGEESANILIDNNLIFNCTDKGISVGQKSTATVKNNVIVNCAQGVGIKDEGSYALIDGNTFYGNDYPIACFEKNIGVGGGSADATNNIFSKSRWSSYFVDELSILNISYSLSDTDNLSGAGNVYADPLFGNNFKLKPNSPAIDAGSPDSPTDPDGTRKDIGAYYYNEADEVFVIINEIHYNPSNGDNSEFIELYNTGNSQIDLSGWSFTKGIDYTFPQGLSLDSDEYIIVAKNANMYSGQGYQVFEWTDGTLSNNWENIQLEDNQGDMIDYVNYCSKYGWVSSPNGTGPSLELRDTSLENLYYANWRASIVGGGTPGRFNAIPITTGLYINEFMAVNSTIIKDDNDQYDDWIELYNSNDKSIDVGGLYITDDLSRPKKYQIPTTNPDLTTIQPYGFLLLWADENGSQGILHLNFKLAGQGEQLGLSQLIEETPVFIDQLDYEEQNTDVSFGRSQDGGDIWQYMYLPTPNVQNVKAGRFEQGILLVNGVSFDVYKEYIRDSYENRAFWGDSTISFWDCFETPADGYPSTLPEPLGHGFVPDYIIHQFSKVIWVGNSYLGDLECWQETNILQYIEAGGNLLLMARRGYYFITDRLKENLGIVWQEEEYNEIQDCIAVYPGMQDVELTGRQNLNSVFDLNFYSNESTLLFKETLSFEVDRGLGVWYKPEAGGTYNSDGGQFVFISGRPYRYNSNQLRSNVEFILGNLFKMRNIDIKENTNIIKKYTLQQNYPNPFNPRTTIRFELPHPSQVSIKIYNIQGKLVKSLSGKKMWEYGSHTITWDGKNDSGIAVSSGVYLYQLKVNEFKKTKKMLFLK